MEQLKKEFIEWCNDDPALELANGVGTFENIADWWIDKIKNEYIRGYNAGNSIQIDWDLLSDVEHIILLTKDN